MYVLLWRTVCMLTWVLFWCLFSSFVQINTKITLLWVHKQFTTQLHTSFYINYIYKSSAWHIPLPNSLGQVYLYISTSITLLYWLKIIYLTVCSLCALYELQREIVYADDILIGSCGPNNSHNYRKSTWLINTLRLRHDGCQFPDDIFKYIILNENVSISIMISLKFVPKDPINNIPALVQIMAWHRPGDKSLSEAYLTLLGHLMSSWPSDVGSLENNNCEMKRMHY